MTIKEKLANYEMMKNECFETRKLNDSLGKLIVVKNKKIKELEAQIEKMKGCENCKYKYIQDSCDLGEGTRTDPCLSCRSNNMWEFDND